MCRIYKMKLFGNQRSARFGFTLIEQLIVLTLIVAILGFGGVRMMKVYRENNYDLVIKELTTVLRFVQMKAIEDGRIYEISVSENKKKFQMKRETDDGKELEPFRSSWLNGIQVGRAFTLELNRGNQLLFFPDGSTSRNSLALVKEAGERATIELKNRIGRVEVRRG
ncbi:MAG: hypothetical protein HY582_03090 [Candidatus Omnitrophica bacterium]|nr:hypothetical protein [Candidatus Omnitrophota bacterium]